MTGQVEQQLPFHLSIVVSIRSLREDRLDFARYGLETLGELIQQTVIPQNHAQIADAFLTVAERLEVDKAYWVEETLQSIEAQQNRLAEKNTLVTERDPSMQPFPGNI